MTLGINDTERGELEAAADQVHWGFLSRLEKKHLDNLQRHLPVMIYGVYTILFELLQSSVFRWSEKFKHSNWANTEGTVMLPKLKRVWQLSFSLFSSPYRIFISCPIFLAASHRLSFCSVLSAPHFSSVPFLVQVFAVVVDIIFSERVTLSRSPP